MADTDTHTASLALYRFLCQNIVGSEKYVKTMRQINTVRDSLTSTKLHTTIISGSFGEGLELRGSDLDVMHVESQIEVYAEEKPRPKKKVLYYRMETDDVKPGFTQLQSEKNDRNSYCQEFNGNYYFSSIFVKQYMLSNSVAQIIHGPCLSDINGNFDFAFCLHCKTWISQASQWISRSNNSWPGYNVKQSIIKHGVLFVPIGVKGSPKEDIEWRISFSVGEKMLISTFTHTQLLCYALLKILLKDVIATYTECSDLLCSYFVKTIMFWISEELPQSVWKPDNLIPCFMRCFRRLIYCVEYSACLHYFIPENDMFENKIEGRAREILLDKLNTLHSYGWQCVLFSDQLSNFHVSMWMDHTELHTLNTIDVAKSLNSKLLRWTNNMTDDHIKRGNYLNNRAIRSIVSCNQYSLKYLYTYYISLWSARYAQNTPLTSPRSCNKHQYKQYKSCLCTLLQNIHHDAVSGWLILASFLYKTKQYSKALLIIIYCLSKFTREKICIMMNMSDIHHRLLKLKSFQEKSLVQLWKIMLVYYMKFGKNSWLIPNELQMEVEKGSCFISSIVFAYFLKFLCHHHLKNDRQCQDCLHTLQLVIAENYFIEEQILLKQKAYTVLGIVLQLSGDNEASRQAFMQSVEIYPDHEFNTSFERLSLLSSE